MYILQILANMLFVNVTELYHSTYIVCIVMVKCKKKITYCNKHIISQSNYLSILTALSSTILQVSITITTSNKI